MSDETREPREFKMVYASNQSHGKSMQQAMELAARARELNADTITVEVKSEETFRLREENDVLAARVKELESELADCNLIKGSSYRAMIAERDQLRADNEFMNKRHHVFMQTRMDSINEQDAEVAGYKAQLAVCQKQLKIAVAAFEKIERDCSRHDTTADRIASCALEDIEALADMRGAGEAK